MPTLKHPSSQGDITPVIGVTPKPTREKDTPNANPVSGGSTIG